MRSSTFAFERRPGDSAVPEADGGQAGRRAADRDPRRRFVMANARPAVRLSYTLMGILFVGYLVSQLFRSHTESWPIIDSWGVAVFEIVGSALCMLRGLIASDRRPLARAVPVLLGSGLMAWSIGDLVLPMSASANGATPALANVLYLCFYPLTYVGVMLRVHLSARRLTAETWLDGVIAGLGAAAVVSALLFHTILNAAGASADVVTTNLAFPIGDLLLLALVIGGSVVLPGRRRLPWILLAVGLAANTLGDTANLFASGLGANHVGDVANAVAWPASILLVSVSVWISSRGSAPIESVPRPSFLLPGLACLTSLALLFVGSLRHVETATLILALATLTVACMRAGLSLRALQRLTLDKQRQAVTDSLTMLGNRRAVYDLLEALEEEAANTGVPRQVACLFIDLNRFKEVNDSFGHSVGDELLHQLGARLKGILRDEDLLARLGGDEFVVALLNADDERGAITAQRIGARLHEPFQLGAVRAQVGASIGIAVAPRDATRGADLLRCADLAMYRAKVAGQPFAIYNEELDGRGNRMGLVADLRAAIAGRELELHYQPQIECASGALVALEALVRWRHPRLGYLPPLEFLPLAEDAELMDPLTELVLDMALAQCARWRAEGSEVSVSVNLSSTNLHNPSLPRLVARLLGGHGLPPDALVLEITETTAITDFARTQETIRQLRDLGLVVSVDDFGAGFTSLAYLSSLAVDELKLDRSFIHGLADSNDARTQALVRATIELAHALGLRVVAEGIEDEASFDLLSELGADLAQGYLISRPLPVEELDLNAAWFRLPRPSAVGL